MAPNDQENSPDDLDREEALLRNEAMKIDPSREEDNKLEDDVTRSERAAARAEQPAKPTADASKTEADRKAAADKQAKENASTDADKAKTEADKKAAADKAAADKKAADEEKNLTPYEKERRRLDKSWKKLEAEKDAIRKDRETIEAEKKKIEDARAKAPAPKTTPEKPKHNGYTAEDYEEAAKEFRAEGKESEAATAERRAKELRAKEAEQAKEAGGDHGGEFIQLPTGGRITADEQKAMTDEWNANLHLLGKENPELTQDGAPLRATVAELLKTHPILHSHGSGIFYAVEVAKLKIAAAESVKLQSRVTELETENKQLKELTSLSPSGGTHRHEKPKVGSSGDLERDENDLRQEAQTIDAQGGNA